MCEFVNRIRLRPPGETTCVPRHELLSLADEVMEALRQVVPGFADLLKEVDREKVRFRVEQALMTAFGHGASTDEIDKATAFVEQRRDRVPQQRGEHERESERARARERERTRDPERERERVPEPGRERVRETPREHDRRSDESAAEHARRELFDVLIGQRPAPGPSITGASLTELSHRARWPLPASVQAVALATPGEAPQLAALGDTLVGAVGEELCLLIPDPDPVQDAESRPPADADADRDPGTEPDGRAALENALRGRAAAVGHVVPLGDAASSLRWARRLIALTPARTGPDTRVVFVDDHLSTLLLLQDESLMRALAARWLKPLEGLTPRQSERLEMTLLAWLEGGGAPEAAKALKVHPQTVRYRLRQIEKLFGPGLRDPRTRFELEMALRGRRLAARMDRVRRHHSRAARRARGVTAGIRPLGMAREARVNGL